MHAAWEKRAYEAESALATAEAARQEAERETPAVLKSVYLPDGNGGFSKLAANFYDYGYFETVMHAEVRTATLTQQLTEGLWALWTEIVASGNDVARDGNWPQCREIALALLGDSSTRASREAAGAARIAALPPVDRSKLCTTDGRSPEEAWASQTNATGQHDSYVVLCDAERAKGFVRPYRDAYKHVGRAICGRILGTEHGWRTICADTYPHAGECGCPTRRVPHEQCAEAQYANRIDGCGSVTTMGRALSETYARDPTFYGATFCVRCNKHFPVSEFVWTADGQTVGS